MSSSTRLLAISFLPVLIFISACTSLYIGAPSLERQTLLVLPVTSRTSWKFLYTYEIKRVDGYLLPYEATFDLPLAGNLLIVDSLPPGEYFVDKLIITPVDSKIDLSGVSATKRHDRFRLKAGGITVFSHTLDMQIRRTEQPNSQNQRYLIVTTSYETIMSPVSLVQREKILAALEELDNFEEWTIFDNDEPVTVDLEKQLLADGYRRLEASEIQFTFEGNTLFGEFDTGRTAILLEPEGTTRERSVSSSGQQSWSRGAWHTMTGGFFCKSWDHWKLDTSCNHVYVHGNVFVFIDLEGKKSAEGDIQPGNVFGL